jgi:hypothetical protein
MITRIEDHWGDQGLDGKTKTYQIRRETLDKDIRGELREG